MSEMTYEEALAHFGTKGMKWGVTRSNYSGRTQNTIDRLNRVADKTATKGDLAKTALGVGRHGVGGIYGIKTAGKSANKLQAHLNRIDSGQATTRDLLIKYGSMNVTQIMRERKT